MSDAKAKTKKQKRVAKDDEDISTNAVDAKSKAPPVSSAGGEEEGDSFCADEPKRKRKRNRTRKSKKDGEGEGDNGVAGASVGNAEPAVAAPSGAKVEGTVYVEGISYDAEDADVKGFFEQAGAVKEVRMPRWHDSGKPRGYAHVVFADRAHAAAAIKDLDGQRLMGRYLKVVLPKAPKSIAAELRFRHYSPPSSPYPPYPPELCKCRRVHLTVCRPQAAASSS